MTRRHRAVRIALAAVLATCVTGSRPVAADAKRAPTVSAEASALFPKIDGWKLSDGPTTYDSDRLFEYIDGGADLFLQFAFQELASATYAKDPVRHGKGGESSPGHSPTAKAEITVDIYRHKDAVRAFGMYSQERPAGTTRLSIGADGYAGADHLEFVVGSYYVKLVQLGGKEPAVLRTFAEKVAASLPGTRKAPALLSCFPERGKRVRAERLAARDFLGHPFLHDAVAVPYAVGQASFRLFVVEGKDNADVRAMVQRYRALGSAKDAGADPVAGQGSLTVKDPLNGDVDLQWKGRWLWGAVDQPCAERASLVEELGRNVADLNQ